MDVKGVVLTNDPVEAERLRQEIEARQEADMAVIWHVPTGPGSKEALNAIACGLQDQLKRQTKQVRNCAAEVRKSLQAIEELYGLIPPDPTEQSVKDEVRIGAAMDNVGADYQQLMCAIGETVATDRLIRSLFQVVEAMQAKGAWPTKAPPPPMKH